MFAKTSAAFAKTSCLFDERHAKVAALECAKAVRKLFTNVLTKLFTKVFAKATAYHMG